MSQKSIQIIHMTIYIVIFWGYVAPLNEKNITEYLEQGYIRGWRRGVR